MNNILSNIEKLLKEIMEISPIENVLKLNDNESKAYRIGVNQTLSALHDIIEQYNN